MDAQTLSAQAEIQQLQTDLHRHNYLYYVLEQPELSDSQYDQAYRRLLELEAEHPEWVTPDSPTQRVGARLDGRLPVITHTYPLYSLDNAKKRQGV